MGSFYVENFGCRATQADGAAIEHQLQARGLERASEPGRAEIVVLNTCTVTAAADQDARAAIRRIHRQNPGAQIMVTGCYAQRAPDEVAALPGVALVIGNSHKHHLAQIALGTSAAKAGLLLPPHSARLKPCPDTICEVQGFVPLASLTADDQRLTTNGQGPIFVSDIFAHTELLAAPVFEAAELGTNNERTRPNLKVQDGCDNRCSFCIIPYVRGHSRSLQPEQVIAEVETLVAAGYREVVISGINLGRWGRDLSGEPMPVWGRVSDPSGGGESRPARPPRFEDLVRAILDHTPLEKLRISSVEPMDWSDALIRLVASSPRIAKHAHVPMQSASDAVLRRMHRRYRPWHYREKIEKIHAAMPTAAIGADVMVGFPGETGAEFAETRRMIEDLPFTYLHVFTYSPRPGTPASQISHQVPVQLARERNRILRDLAAQKKQAFMRSFVGKKIEAITLRTCGADTPVRESGEAEFTEALTDNYLKLRLQGRHQANRWITARVEGVEAGALVGELCAC